MEQVLLFIEVFGVTTWLVTVLRPQGCTAVHGALRGNFFSITVLGTATGSVAGAIRGVITKAAVTVS